MGPTILATFPSFTQALTLLSHFIFFPVVTSCYSIIWFYSEYYFIHEILLLACLFTTFHLIYCTSDTLNYKFLSKDFL